MERGLTLELIFSHSHDLSSFESIVLKHIFPLHQLSKAHWKLFQKLSSIFFQASSCSSIVNRIDRIYLLQLLAFITRLIWWAFHAPGLFEWLVHTRLLTWKKVDDPEGEKRWCQNLVWRVMTVPKISTESIKSIITMLFMIEMKLRWLSKEHKKKG